MAAPTSQTWRNNPFSRNSPSPSPAPQPLGGRPKSMVSISSPPSSSPPGHGRNQSFSPLSGNSLALPRTAGERSSSNRNATPLSNTFAPKFIQTEEAQKDTERVRGIEGENDFSGKRYVWIKDNQVAFVKGWVMEELGDSQLLIQCDDGSVYIYTPFQDRNG